MNASLSLTPAHRHDCDACRYYGTIVRAESAHDVYTCAGSLVLRTGSDGPDYESMPLDLAARIPSPDYQRALSLVAALAA